MKAGILTFTNTLNYGAVLQAYALQEKVRALGCEVEVIQYVNKDIEDKEKGKSFSLIFKNPKAFLKKLTMGKALKNKEKAFKEYERLNVNLGKKYDNTTISRAENDYDCFITGSDQVWNMGITHNDWNFYLDFVKDPKKKLSYAPSFGNSAFPDEQKEKAGKLLNEISALSVREKSGKELIKEMAGRDAEVVVDPTLLLNKNEWESKIKFKPNIDKYILVYFPHNKKLVFDFVEKLKVKTGLPVIYLSISPRKQGGVQTIYDASPDEFLGWIKNAEYVVTGSFHGTAFSLNLEKQFFYEPLNEGGIEGRIENLTRLTGTQDRCITSADMSAKIDYKNVRVELDRLRECSSSWLKNALEI